MLAARIISLNKMNLILGDEKIIKRGKITIFFIHCTKFDERMNRYTEIRVLGQGSYGKATLCKRKQDGKIFVIKEMRTANLSKVDRDAALNEATLLSSLNHPYIIKYEESFQERECFYIVMEYADGGDLAQKIRNRQNYFSENEILQTFIQLSLAIKYIHDRKILHRDLKAQNVFLMKDGTVKLGDFGIARVLENTFQLCHTRIGTPYYLSPEICEGNTYNSKTDIWSLGCILYELCTLRHAFNAQNMAALAVQIIRGKYEPIPSCFSPELSVLIKKMLTSDQRLRPSINGVLNTPILKSKLHLFLSNAESQRNQGMFPAQIKPQVSNISPIKLSPNRGLKQQIKSSVSEPDGLVLERQYYQDRFLKLEANRVQNSRQKQIEDLIKKAKEDLQRRKQKDEEDLKRRKQESYLRYNPKLKYDRYGELNDELDTIGRIRHNEFKEARENAILNKRKAQIGGLSFDNDTNHLNINSDNSVNQYLANNGNNTKNLDNTENNSQDTLTLTSNDNENISQNDFGSKFNSEMSYINIEDSLVGFFNNNDRSNQVSLSQESLHELESNKNETDSNFNTNKKLNKFYSESSLSRTNREDRKRLLFEQRTAIQENRNALKTMELETQELASSQNLVDKSSMSIGKSSSTNIPLIFTSQDTKAKPVITTPVTNSSKSILSRSDIFSTLPEFQDAKYNDSKKLLSINSIDQSNDNLTYTKSRLKELGIDPTLARNENDRKILIDLDMELSGKSTSSSRPIRSQSRNTVYLHPLIDTNVTPKKSKDDDTFISQPRPLLQLGVVEAKNHLSQIQSLVASITHVLKMPNDADGKDESFEIPTHRSISHDLINQEVKFPVVKDSDSLMYRAEAMRAFLERELGLEEFITLRHEIESENNGNEVISKYPNVLPGFIVILQQLLVLEHLIDDM